MKTISKELSPIFVLLIIHGSSEEFAQKLIPFRFEIIFYFILQVLALAKLRLIPINCNSMFKNFSFNLKLI